MKLKTKILVAYLLILHAVLIFFLVDKFYKSNPMVEENKVQPVIALSTPIEIPGEPEISANQNRQTTPTPKPPEIVPGISNSDDQNLNQPQINTGKLMIPVIGVKKSALTDTFNDARSEGRVHNAIDIMAKGGTPVIAAADGEIAKFFDSKLGGITIYQYSVDKKQIYYYAHLQKRDDNLSEHQFVKQGTVIGYVGDTGNAGAGNYHLHFGISILEDPKKYWQGTEINPFPLLKNGIEVN